MAKKKKTVEKVTYGKRDLLSDQDFRNPKIRISMMVDEKIIKVFKERAKESGEGYQTIMHRVLVEASKKPSLEERVSRLEGRLKVS